MRLFESFVLYKEEKNNLLTAENQHHGGWVIIWSISVPKISWSRATSGASFVLRILALGVPVECTESVSVSVSVVSLGPLIVVVGWQGDGAKTGPNSAGRRHHTWSIESEPYSPDFQHACLGCEVDPSAWRPLYAASFLNERQHHD